MDQAVQFNNVFKRYRTGVQHTSLRDALPAFFSRLLMPGDDQAKGGDHIWALNGVSFILGRSQTMGVIGPNGAGKTTILKILSKITRPTNGNVDVNGRVSALIELGAGFHPDLTGRENLYLNGAILGLSNQELENRYDRIVEFSGLHNFMDTPVKRYSSGMYVRLGFSIAAYVEPDILIVDEVLAVGDASFRRKCIEHIRMLQEKGTSIVFVSHNMNLIRSVCDHGIFLLNGKIEASGDIVNTIRAYETYLRKNEVNTVRTLNLTHQNLDTSQTPVDIIGIELMNELGQPSKQFSYDEKVEVRVRYNSEVEIPSPNLLARIIRSDGITSCEIRSRNDNISLPHLKGTGCISFFMEPIQLASGAYVLEVHIQDTNDVSALAIGQSEWFQVYGPGVTVVYEYSGIYIPKVIWNFSDNR